MLRRPALTSLLLLALAGGAFGQGLDSWFDRAPEAAAYASIRGQAAAEADRLRAAGLAESPLRERLEEGARKRVPPPRLALALKDEADRLVSISSLLSERGLKPERPEGAAQTAGRFSLLLRAGCPLPAVAAALDAAPAYAKSAPAAVDRALASLSAIVSIQAHFPLEIGEASALSAALARSRLDADRFDSILALFTRYRAYGLPSSRIVATCVPVLDEGGSVDRLERELQRRLRSR